MTLSITVASLICLHVSSGFNLAPHHAIVIADPTWDDYSYFGYAINFRKQSSYSGQQVWLIVGAPRGTSNHPNHRLIKQPGAVYQCKIENGLIPSCLQIVVDSTADTRRYSSGYWDKKDNSWIGGTIAVEDGMDGKLVVCGSRFMKQNDESYLMPGMCYYWSNDGSNSGRLTSLTRRDYWTTPKQNAFYFGFSQSGFSAHFVQNTSDLLVGAPGLHYWEGAMARYQAATAVPGWQSSHGFNSVNVPYSTNLTDIGAYFGYAVGSGRFHSARDRVSYIAGAPKAGELSFTGKVYIVESPLNKRWNLLTTLQGQQMGEYFGSSLLALDINNDGLDDLMVGAPLYSYRSTDESYVGGDHGRVYVFINKGEARLETNQNLMGSTQSEARFGSALASIGDINKDGFQDLAVGAPYEGKGAVYIYHGNTKGFGSRYSQRIAATDISYSLSGFGISIAPGLDIDNNSFNDVAIGSYESAHAVVIKSYPIIDFYAHISPSVSRLDVNATEFTIEACLRYTSNVSPGQISRLDARLRLRVDTTLGRAIFPFMGANNNDVGRQMSLLRNVDNCWKLDVHLKENNNQVIQPLEIEMTYHLSHNPMDDKNDTEGKQFCSFCPVIDPNKPSSTKIKIPFANGCESNEACRADLKVWARFFNVKHPFILGSKKRISLRVYVTNNGDPAYLAKLSIETCPESRLVRIPQTCYMQQPMDTLGAIDETIICNLENPLLGYNSGLLHKSILQFDIDISSIHINQSELIFKLKTWSASEEKDIKDNTFSLSLAIQLIADITITGQSKPSQVMLSKKDGTIQQDIFHVYEVTNEGPSPVELVQIQFKIPVGLEPGSIVFLHLYDPHVLLRDQIFSCAVDRNFMTQTEPSTAEIGHTLDYIDNTRTGGLDITPLRRRKRALWDSTWFQNKTSTIVAPINHTMFVNCTSQDSTAVCLQIECLAGPFVPNVDRAKVIIRMTVRLNDVEVTMRGKETLQLTSAGRVSIVNAQKYIPPLLDRPDIENVHTLFLGELNGEEVASWILPLSVAIGLLLLMIIVKSLVKVGFFRRNHRERLQSLKDSAAEEDFGPMDSMDYAEESALNDEDVNN